MSKAMTISEAFELLMATAVFGDIAKKKNDKDGSYYRMCRTRFRRGDLKNGAMIDLLIKHDYKVSVKK